MIVSKVVVVIAGHRTGSGLMSQLLNRLGVDMGLPAASPELHVDDLGEDQQFVALHRAMLQERVAADWQRPIPRLTPALAQQWIALVRQRSNKPVWGFKDPRFVFLADFGLGVLATLAIDVHIVWLSRAVWSVGVSLQNRDGTHYPEAVAIARRYETQWSQLRDRYAAWPSCDIAYEDLVVDPVAQLTRVTDALKLLATPACVTQAAGIVRRVEVSYR